jgi:DNA-binding SARP family transcriptional activator
MAGLDVRLLGGFEARVAVGGALALPTRKTQGLLAYLALPPGRSHPRDKLTAIFWTDLPDSQARQNLRQTLFSIRRAARAVGHEAELLRGEGESVALEPAGVQVDAVTFEGLARGQTIQDLEQALALYQGDLLAGLLVGEQAFEEWLMGERERLHELALEAMARLVTLLSQGGQVDRAIQVGTRLLALDPLQEAVHRTLMRLYIRAGRRDAALRQYQVCRDVLKRELGSEPERDTRRLYHELLLLRGVAEPARPMAAEPSAELPVVGRAPEQDRLRTARVEGWSGKARLVLLAGEAGIGKSRLLDGLVAESQGEGGTVLLGRTWEIENVLPLGPWIEALRRLLRAEGGEAIVAALDPGQRTHLRLLLPELGESAAPAGAQDQSQALFETIVQVLVHVAARQPLLVALEDLHWADEMSVRLLGFVVRRLGGWPALVVASVRTEELAGAPVLERLLRDLDVEERLTRIDLARLPREATAELVRRLAVRSPRPALARLTERAWRLSEGNPFMIVEAVRAPQEPARERAVGRLPLPDRVREVITGRLERLSERARSALGVAAVLGGDIEFDTLRHASGLDEGPTADALEELVRRRVLEHTGTAFAFDHDQVRHVAYERLLPARRRLLHRAAGEALEAVHGGRLDEIADRLAHHFAQAGTPDKAVAYLERFAAAARRRYALDDAIRALDEALTHVEALPEAERPRRRLDVLLRQAFMMSIRGRFMEILAALLPHQDGVLGIGDPALTGPFFFRLGLTTSILGLHDDARRFAERAREAAETVGDAVTLGRSFYVLSAGDFSSGRFREAITHGGQAVVHLSATTERLALGQAHWIVGLSHQMLGEFDTAIEVAGGVKDVAAAAGDVGLQALGAVAAGWSHCLRGTLDEAVAEAEWARDRSPHPPLTALAGGLAAYARRLRGEAVDAVTPLARAVELEARHNRKVIAGVLLGDACLLAGDLPRARETAEKAAALAAELKFAWGIAAAERTLGRAARDAGALDEARRRMGAALAAFEEMDAAFEAELTRRDLAALPGDG